MTSDTTLAQNGDKVTQRRDYFNEDEVRILWHQSAAGEIPVPYLPETGKRNERLLPLGA